uniref:Uncharacterized protein n=1 Tax=Glossina austeni TaxID=7395 RepID=A0A1A9V8G7_GLOAU
MYKNLRIARHKYNAFTAGSIDTTAANFALRKDKPFLLAHFSLEGKKVDLARTGDITDTICDERIRTKEQNGLSDACYKTSTSTQTMLSDVYAKRANGTYISHQTSYLLFNAWKNSNQMWRGRWCYFSSLKIVKI